ncbi:hypothetical protein [Synoicihabitans lomoniglobus]|uniref:DUF2062 domain-containing protein n=1 Tax=Synoicihabitans lomoniglobus TaxID=2909285 RepID=A0AAE9ZXY8_9BACT|nr:DUF2062 domain-containing protein [Opitutaceae bacterium LMO-M01]WED65379.1 DUF2062 domain-containing protein [Opitutaceae bacterium LMO-M01]
MIITRKIGSILRGKATPFQLMVGCTLGALLGFLPGFMTAPGLTLALALLLVLLNANLFLAAVAGALAKLVSLALLPVSFAIGRLLLEGPTEGLFRAMVNTPGLALLGVENYAATGGLVMGLVVGLILGWLVVRGVTTFRHRMANASEHSEKFQKWNNRAWVRWSVFLLAGGGLKDPDYAALAAKKVGNPIRPLGAAFVILSLVLTVTVLKFFAPTIITTALRDGLERANGATVDIATADLDLGAGRLVVTGLAVTDPNNLDTNLLAAERLEADISGTDLLRKRLTIDRIVMQGATLSQARRVPGRRVSTAPDADGEGIKLPDTGTIEDYVANAKLWRQRLAQAKSWLDRFSGSTPPGESTEIGAEGGTEDTWSERLQRIAAERGYAEVTADHLIADSPTLLVSDLEADNVKAAWLPEETLAIHARNLSTQPWLVDAPASVEITSSGNTAGLTVQAGSTSRLAAHYRGVPAATISDALKRDSAEPLLDGGTVDLAFDGTYSAIDGTIDWPLDVTLHHTTARIAGRAVPLDNFTLPIGLTGALDSPRIKLDQNQLGRIAKQAGTQLIKEKATEAIGEKAGGLLKGLLGGSKDETPDEGN